MELRWRLICDRKLLSSGSGSTLDLSGAGIVFDAGRPLPAGSEMEVSIAWPVLLDDTLPVQLVVSGRILHCNGNTVALRILQHEFRTVPASQGQSHAARGVQQKQRDRLVLRIQDNSRGFDPEDPSLLGMRERAASLGGGVGISSAPGKGTSVPAWVPLRLPEGNPAVMP